MGIRGRPATPARCRRPAAALGGDTGTAWLADRVLARERHHLDVTFTTPRDVPTVRLMPYSDSRGQVRAVTVNGRRFAVRRGWNVLATGLRDVGSLRVAIADVRRPRRVSGGGGGIRELAIPGVRVREALRPPVLAERALRGADLSRTALTYLFARTTADAPALVERFAGERQAGLVRDARDPERQLARVFAPPGARRWRADAWVSVDPRASDGALDRLAGTTGAVAATSSSRFENRPRHRASGAFDGGSRAWVGQWIAGRPAWIAWRARTELTLRTLRLEPARLRVRRPTVVTLRADGGRPTAPLAVGRDGRVVLPQALRGRAFRLDVVRARLVPGTPGRERRRRAVAIGELRAPGLERVRVPRDGGVRGACGAAAFAVGGRRVALAPRGRQVDLDAGRPLRARACGAPVALGAGAVSLSGAEALLRVDHLRLSSAAPVPTPGPRPSGGRVLDAGVARPGRRRAVRVQVDAPAWLVLGESFSRGWRARCDGRDLGAPTPLQGYANAWRVMPGCRDVAFTFAPDEGLKVAYLVSLVGALILLGLLVVRRRRPASTPAPGELPDADPAIAWPLRRALAAGIVAAALFGFVFALRAGVVLGPLTALVLWRGVGVRALIAVAGALLIVVVPALYVLDPARDRGGYSTTYALDHLGAHWVTAGALAALGLALVRTLSRATGRDAGGPPPAP